MERLQSPEERYPRTGIYEHYKSTAEDRKYYQVLGFARHTETDETLVMYLPLYTDPSHGGLRIQARPLDMFTETVEHEGERIPRFRYIGQEL